jgi:phospholipid/cholesterol/gamma-HCH transport system substrate-binding protein
METRANHLIIGSFVLLFVAAAFAFIIWVAKIQIDQEFAHYDIVFADSVAGLGVGGDVRFNGIKVGSVQRIRIDPHDPAKVKVTVSVAADTPIRTNSFAQLELQGITGVSYVQITGGTAIAPLLTTAEAGQDNPVIQSRPSKIAELFQGVPDLLARSVTLVDRASELLNPQNQQNLAGVLSDLRTVTTAIADRQQAIGRIIDGLDRATGDIAATTGSVRDIAGRFDRLAGEAEKTLGETTRTVAAARGAIGSVDAMVNGEGKQVLAEAGKLAVSLNKLTGEMQALVAENRQPLREFTEDGMQDIRSFVNEARVLVSSLARVAARLEDDPSQVLFGAKESEYKAERQ